MHTHLPLPCADTLFIILSAIRVILITSFLFLIFDELSEIYYFFLIYQVRYFLTTEQILAEHPDLESEDIHACLRFASERLNHPVLAA